MSKFFKKLFGKKDKAEKAADSVAGNTENKAKSAAGKPGKVAGDASKTAENKAGDASKTASKTADKVTHPTTGSTAAENVAGAAPSSGTGLSTGTGASAPTGAAAATSSTAKGSSGSATGAGLGAGAGAGAGAAGAAGAATTSGTEGTTGTTGSTVNKTATTGTSTTSSKAKIAIISHSLWGHVDTLVQSAAKGVESSGASVELFNFGETLPAEVLEKMHANKTQPYPAITPDKLKEFDGFLIAAATRFGRLPAQVDTFFDQTGGLWATGALVGKFAGILTSTGTGGGNETTFLTTLPWLVHNGISFVSFGYQAEELSDVSVKQGGTPWGASTIANADGSRQVNEAEKNVAQKQGAYFGNFVGTYKKGLTASA